MAFRSARRDVVRLVVLAEPTDQLSVGEIEPFFLELRALGVRPARLGHVTVAVADEDEEQRVVVVVEARGASVRLAVVFGEDLLQLRSVAMGLEPPAYHRALLEVKRFAFRLHLLIFLEVSLDELISGAMSGDRVGCALGPGRLMDYTTQRRGDGDPHEWLRGECS